jgi:hypothetical protein
LCYSWVLDLTDLPRDPYARLLDLEGSSVVKGGFGAAEKQEYEAVSSFATPTEICMLNSNLATVIVCVVC